MWWLHCIHLYHSRLSFFHPVNVIYLFTVCRRSIYLYGPIIKPVHFSFIKAIIWTCRWRTLNRGKSSSLSSRRPWCRKNFGLSYRPGHLMTNTRTFFFWWRTRKGDLVRWRSDDDKDYANIGVDRWRRNHYLTSVHQGHLPANFHYDSRNLGAVTPMYILIITLIHLVPRSYFILTGIGNPSHQTLRGLPSYIA